MFWITVGQARRQTAPEIGPSTIERSNERRGGGPASAGGAALAGTSAAAVEADAAVPGGVDRAAGMPQLYQRRRVVTGRR
jgi:hypothetical protein